MKTLFESARHKARDKWIKAMQERKGVAKARKAYERATAECLYFK